MKKALFFVRKDCNYAAKTIEFLKTNGFSVRVILSEYRSQDHQKMWEKWHGEYLFSFRSFYIIPKKLLDRVKVAAINFHPGPNNYRGSGGLNFALLNNEKQFGVTAHLINENIDDGEIIECRKFNIYKSDFLDSLMKKTHKKLFDLFCDITGSIKEKGANYLKKKIPNKKYSWVGPIRKFKEVEKLKKINVNISRSEFMKIIRATYTKKYPPKIVFYGKEFYLKQ